MSGKVTEIHFNAHTPRPVCVQFQNGKLKEGQEKHLKTAILKSGKDILAAAATREILYTGCVNRDEDLYNNFLFLRNRRTGKVRLVAIDNVVLSPRLHFDKVDNLNTTSTKSASATGELNKTFGSKRIKRMTEQRERLTMDIGNVQEQLEHTVSKIEVSESDMFSNRVDENDSAYRPPINRNASTKEQIYELYTLVPEKVLDSLEEEAESALQADLSTINLSQFITKRLTELQEAEVKNKSDKCKILLLVNYLIKFIVTPAKSITKRFIVCSSSKEVNDHILENFSVVSTTGRTRPLSMRDKTICYILILTAIACDFQVDIESLSKDVKIGVKKMQQLARILAFSVSGKDKNVFLLKIPLPPPVSVLSKKRKR